MIAGATIALFAMLVASLAGQSRAPAADEAAVRAVIERYVNARELRDPAAIEALFTRDADQLTSSGEWRRGRDAVVPGTLESSRRNPGTRQIVVEAVRFVTADVAIVDGPYNISVAGAAARPMRTTIVLKREADAWRIAAIRNIVPTGATR